MAEWDLEVFWKETMNQIRSELGDQEFGVWFTSLEYLGVAGENGVLIGVPSAFYRDQVKTRYQDTIIGKLNGLTGRNLSLNFELKPGKNTKTSASRADTAPQNSGPTGQNGQNTGVIAPTQAAPAAKTSQVPASSTAG